MFIAVNSKLTLDFCLKTALLIVSVLWDEFRNVFYAGTAFLGFHKMIVLNTLDREILTRETGRNSYYLN